MEKERLLEEHWKLKNRVVAGLVVFGLYSILLTVSLVYGAFQLGSFSNQIQDLHYLMQELQQGKVPDQHIAGVHIQKPVNESESLFLSLREVISGKNVISNLKSNLANLPGISEKDAASIIPVIVEIVSSQAEKAVQKEWLRVSSDISRLGGATYVRWGRKSCPETASLIYEGLAAGPDYRTPGGAVNFQCLPSDPEYDPRFKDANVLYQGIGKVLYEYIDNPDLLGPNILRRQVPCAVCEAEQRASKLMIPGRMSCPSKEGWTEEYQGVLVGQLSQRPGIPIATASEHFRTTYECLDGNPETYSKGPPPPFGGGVLHLVSASCDGEGNLNHCPPYEGGKVISCVVCTK